MTRVLLTVIMVLITLMGLQRCQVDGLSDALATSNTENGQLRTQKQTAIDTNAGLNESLDEVLAEMAMREQWAMEREAEQRRSLLVLKAANLDLEEKARENKALAAQLNTELHPVLYDWLWPDARAAVDREDGDQEGLPRGDLHPADSGP